MDISNNKVVVLALGPSHVNDCIKTLEENGFDVEVQPSRDTYPDYLSAEVIEYNAMPVGSLEKKDDLLVKRTCKYLSNNICDKLALDDVAYTVGSNRSQLAASFKRILGVGVFEWRRKQRLSRARSLLLHSDLSIQEIGFEVGYENSANFSSAYKKQFNTCPREERKQAKIEVITLSKVLLT